MFIFIRKKILKGLLSVIIVSILFIFGCSLPGAVSGYSGTSGDLKTFDIKSDNGSYGISKSVIMQTYESKKISTSKIIIKFKPGDALSPENYFLKKLNKYSSKKFKRIISDEIVSKIHERTRRQNKGYSKAMGDFIFSTASLYTLDLESASENEVKALLNTLNNDTSVEYAEPDYPIIKSLIPNDFTPKEVAPYNWDWGLAKVQALEAWDITTGSFSVIVAVIDTGVDYTHRDLEGNIISGYDFGDNDSDPMDTDGHGTSVSGILGAKGNNDLWNPGLCWNIKIMPLKHLRSDGSVYTSDAVKCIDYAVANGANILNNSWGGSGFSQILYDAIKRARDADVLFVAAAGNGDPVNNIGMDIDVMTFYPAKYNLENVITVANSTNLDELHTSSNFGAKTVHLAAPGTNINSLWLSNHGCSATGTSIAAPFVTGTAALIKSIKSDLSYYQIKKLILENVDIVPGLNGKVATSGRLNVYRSVLAAANLNGLKSIHGVFEFKTPGIYTWNINQIMSQYPNAINLRYNITIIGGGGGGGGSASKKYGSGYGAGGGGGGAGLKIFIEDLIIIDPADIAITVGLGGTGGNGGGKTYSGGTGGAGGYSLFSSLWVASGGQGGQGGDNDGGSADGAGGSGFPAGSDNYGNGYGGNGGNNNEGYGEGAAPASSGRNGGSALSNTGGGGGGAGGAKTDHSGNDGGSGGSGLIRIEWSGYTL